MKAAAKTQKSKRQEEQTNFISWRFALLCGCILLALVFLLGRAAWLQIIAPDMLVRQGDMRSLRVQEVSTSRGMITDRSGRPLAVSVPVKAIGPTRKKFMTPAASASAIAGKRFLLRSIFRSISSLPVLTPTRKGVLFIWRAR